MRRSKVEPLLYIAVALLYSMRVSLLGSIAIATKGLFILFFALSVYYFVKANQLSRRGQVLQYLNVIVGLVIIYGLVFFASGVDSTWLRPTSPFAFLYSYLESILPIYAFYYFGRKGWIDDKWFRRVAVLFVLYAAYTFYTRQNMFLNSLGMDEDMEFTNNAGYGLLALFPLFAFFRKKPILLYGLMIVDLFAIMYSQKRGAILLGILCVGYIYLFLSKDTKSIRKLFVLIAFVVISVVATRYIQNLMETSARFNSRMVELANAEASGREVMYPRYFWFYISSGFFNLIFGHGADGTCHYLGLMAHNDWLEFLINMGIVGFVPLLLYWISLFKFWKKCRRVCSPEIVLATGMFVIIYFGKSMFSMSIMGMSVIATAVFGYCLATYDNIVRTGNHL